MNRTMTLAEVKTYIKVQIDFVAMWHDNTPKTIELLNQLLWLEDNISKRIDTDEIFENEYQDWIDCCADGPNGFNPNITQPEYFLCSYYLEQVSCMMEGDLTFFDEDDYVEKAKSIIRSTIKKY